jgi:hypothetical protein
VPVPACARPIQIVQSARFLQQRCDVKYVCVSDLRVGKVGGCVVFAAANEGVEKRKAKE